MLAQTVPNLLPPLSHAEQIAATKLHSLAGTTSAIITKRPFRAPHHSASRTAIIGGDQPGEISLAHTGVLFLDELPEFRRDLLEALRQPLENKVIAITRTKYRKHYPADFMLIATMNPCPCGYYGSDSRTCKCTPTEIHHYEHRLSGPLLDRIDITIHVDHADNSVLLKTTTSSTQEHMSAKKQIVQALNKQFKRQRKPNANLSSYEVMQNCHLAADAKQLLELASRKHSFSARSFIKTIKVAQTIADLENRDIIEASHISEALHFRDTL